MQCGDIRVVQYIRSLLPFTSYPYTGEYVSCNLCGSRETTLICNKDRRWKPLRTVACTDCGLMRTDPMPTDEELERYYRLEYRFDYQLAGRRPPRFHLVRSMRDANERAARLGTHLRPGARVLDVGCGTGEFLKVARDRGCDVLGIEPGSAYAQFARSEHGLNVINAPWQEARLPEADFDVVTCNQVIEHLRDPMAAIAALARWLRPDGVAFIAVPDMRPNARPSFERFHFAHIHGFTPETLDAAMRSRGLVPDDGRPLSTTSVIFRKVAGAAPAQLPLRDRARAQVLAEGYPDDTVASHVFGGGYFRDASHRFAKWRRDTFSA